MGDIIYALKDMYYALRTPKQQAKNYWDEMEERKFYSLTNMLLDTEAPERYTVRHILRGMNSPTLLDAACGPAGELKGYKKFWTHDHDKIKYTGVDRSERMLSRAKQVSRQYSAEIPFVRADVEALPFANASYDIVLLRHILEHLPGYEKAIAEASRVAKNMVIIDLFHHLKMPFDFKNNRRGYWNNWYARKGFEQYIQQHCTRFETMRTKTKDNTTAEIYILHKNKPAF